jgi:hypothetical protein
MAIGGFAKQVGRIRGAVARWFGRESRLKVSLVVRGKRET